VPYGGAVYELVGELPCATVTADRWTDIGPVLAGGSWVATFASAGSIAIDMVVPEMADARTRSMVLIGDGNIRTTVAATVVTTTMTRAGESRPVFRLALDRVPFDGARGGPSSAQARLRAGGARPSLRICAFSAVHPLIEPGRTSGVLRPDFESEAYFGAGWSDAQRTATGPVRRGEDGATLFLPLEPGVAYRLLLDLVPTNPDDAFDVDVTLNGVSLGACRPHDTGACNLLVPPAAVVAGTNTLRLSLAQGSLRHVMRVTLREARIYNFVLSR
jgi:hypothetical protein